MVVVDFESLGALFDRLDLGCAKDVLMGAYNRFSTGRPRHKSLKKSLMRVWEMTVYLPNNLSHK